MTTDNHRYHTPDRGTEDWDSPLNENFEQFDADIELRDTEGNRGNYEPKGDTKFLATDTGRVYLGDGAEWRPSFAIPRFQPSTDSDQSAPNLISGHPENSVPQDVRGATIAGGGLGLAAQVSPNEVSANFGTIGGGWDNAVSGNSGTICGGSNNIAGGVGAAVLGGASNRAEGRRSVAAGVLAYASHDNTFVWNTSNNSSFESTDRDQFLINAPGGVGVGTNEPASQLHVSGFRSENASSPAAHIATVENRSGGSNADVLALKIGFGAPGRSGPDGEPDAGNNFVSFYNGTDDLLGEIQGDGSGGVSFFSRGADYAEYLPKQDPTETIRSGDLVGVHAGELSKRTHSAERVMVVSESAIVLGNSPLDDGDATDYEPVAFVGQVRTRVRGPVEPGDLIVPSGEADGTGTAVSPGHWRPDEYGPVVGQAWEADATDDVTRVTVTVGVDRLDAVAGLMREQRELIEGQQTQLDELCEEMADLRRLVTGAGDAQADSVAD